MKIRSVITIIIVFFSCTTHGDQAVDLSSPEGWAMAFMTTSAQNLGQIPPQAVNIKDISISAELSSIPHLSKEQQKVGLGGFKDEDLNKSPAFGKCSPISLTSPPEEKALPLPVIIKHSTELSLAALFTA